MRPTLVISVRPRLVGPALAGALCGVQWTATLARAQDLAPPPAAAAAPRSGSEDASTAPSSDDVAGQLFERARQRQAEGDYQAAAQLFAASFQASPAPEALIRLADCDESLGKLESARAAFARTAELAEAGGDEGLAQRAHTREAALVPRVPRLEIRVPAPLPPGLLVTLDGIEVPPERLNAPQPLDAATYRLRASAPGYTAFEDDVSIVNASTPALGPRVISVVLAPQAPSPPAEPEPSSRPPRSVAPPPALEGSKATVPDLHREPSSLLFSQSTLAWAAIGAGALLGGIAVGLLVNAQSKYDQASASCIRNAEGKSACDETGRALQRQAIHQANWATALTGGATLAVGAGIYLNVTATAHPGALAGATVHYGGTF